MPPSNVTALTALDVTSGVDVNLDVSGLAAPYTTWYKYTLRNGEKFLAAWSRPSAFAGTNNRASYSIYTGPASAPVLYDTWGDSGPSRPKEFPLTSSYPTMTAFPAGTEFFFEVHWLDAPAPNRNLLFTVWEEPVSVIPTGAIVISSDAEAFPLSGLNWDGSVYGFIHHSNGEGGTIMINGINAHTNKTTGDLDVYSAAPALIQALTLSKSVGGIFARVSSDRSTKFYVNYTGVAPYAVDPGIIYVVSTAGVLLSTITFAGRGIFKHAPAWDNSILYLTDDTATSIKRWDLVGAAFLSDLYTLPANHIFKDDLVAMEDGSLMAGIRQTVAPFAESILHLSAAGATINTIVLPGGVAAVGTFLLNRMANSVDGDTFVAWLRDASILDQFREYNQDGTLIRTVEFEQFDTAGDSDTVTLADDMAHFGPSNSCPVMIAMVPWITEGPGVLTSGMFILVPAMRNDLGEAIPTPTFRTALMP